MLAILHVLSFSALFWGGLVAVAHPLTPFPFTLTRALLSSCLWRNCSGVAKRRHAQNPCRVHDAWLERHYVNSGHSTTDLWKQRALGGWRTHPTQYPNRDFNLLFWVLPHLDLRSQGVDVVWGTRKLSALRQVGAASAVLPRPQRLTFG